MTLSMQQYDFHGPDVAWPAARFGAVFACAGWEEPADGDCKTNCPKVEVALGLTPPPDGISQPAGALVLVGGEGVGGPLADIWRYEEVATSIRPASAEIGDPGPWPTGWKQTGTLPGVDGGLTAPGSVQVDRTLWLIGGRTASGPTADIFKVDLESGTADRVDSGGAVPAGRVTPAVAYDSANHRLVAFGGVDAYGRGLPETWGFDLWAHAWSLVTPACVGENCPQASGHELLRIDRPTGELTIISDRPTSTPVTASWTYREGSWVSAGERASAPGIVDCDGDTTTETLFGLRCGAGSGGFPDYGRMRCSEWGLACRAPVVPASVVWEYPMPEMRVMVAHRGELLTLHGSRVEAYTIGADGLLSAPRVLRLRRAGHDVAAVDDALVVADDGGVSLYARKDGTLLSRIDVCGRARRVFADGALVYVLGLLQLTILDVGDPSAPTVLQQIRFIPGRDEELELRSTSSCSRVDRGLERLCDAIGACGDGCVYRPTFETRLQATPGLECRRLSVDEIEDGLLRFAGDGSEVIITEATDPSLVWRYSRPTGCWEKVEEAQGPAGEVGVIVSVAGEFRRLAFFTTWDTEPMVQHCELIYYLPNSSLHATKPSTLDPRRAARGRVRLRPVAAL